MEMNLTEGFFKEIMQGNKIENPIVQIMSVLKDGVRRKVEISDGVFFTELPSALSWKVLELLTDEELQPWSVVVLNKYQCSKLNNPNKGKWIMILIDKMTVLRKGCIVGKLIGNPIPATDYQVEGLSAFEKSLLESRTIPIAALDSTSNCLWCIKARVISKGDIQKSNEDEFFNLKLADSSSCILATAYNDACSKFYNLIEVNKVYLIKQYHLQRDETSARKFKLVLKYDSEIEPTAENMKFNFCTIRSIKDAPLNTKIDVIGICLHSSEVINYEDESRKGLLRYLRLCNPKEHGTGNENVFGIRVMLWNEAAQKIDISTTPVVAIHAADIVEKSSGVRYLSVHHVTQVFVNPDIKEAREIKMLNDIQMQRMRMSITVNVRPQT